MDGESRSFSIARALVAFAWKAGLVFLLIYGALQLLVRSDFFRNQVEKELSSLAGMEVRVGRIRATESLNLRIRDTIGISDVAGIEARLARIRWRLFRPRGEAMLQSVRVDGLALTIAPDRNGVVQPAFLGRLSRSLFEWTGVTLPGKLASAVPPSDTGSNAKTGGTEMSPGDWMRGPLILRNVSVRWQDAQGALLASVAGMDVVWMAMVAPNGQRIAHLDCRAAEFKLENRQKITGLHVELIEAAGKRFLVELEATDWGGAPPPPAPATEARALLEELTRPVE